MYLFLGSETFLWPCLSVCRSVGRSLGRSVIIFDLKGESIDEMGVHEKSGPKFNTYLATNLCSLDLV